MSERPPRVLHVGKYLPPVPGGIETYLGDLLRVSMRHGMPVGAIVHEKKGYPKPNPDDFGGAKIYSVQTYGQLLYAPVAPSFPWRLRQAILDFKPDILHLHMPNTSAFAALLLPEARRIPWVVHWHADVEFTSATLMHLAYPVYALFETAALRRARTIVATSASYLRASRTLLKWSDRCRVIPLGIDTSRVLATGEQVVGESADFAHRWPSAMGLRLLYVGRLAEYKGLHFLLEVMSQLRGLASLVIVGEGVARAALQREIDRRELRDSVSLFGYASDAELRAFFRDASLLCLPSSNRNEAFGLVLLEASAFGLPIVASDLPGSGVSSVVQQIGGKLLPSESVREWVNYLANRCRAGAEVAHPVVLPSCFDLDSSVGQLAAVYNSN